MIHKISVADMTREEWVQSRKNTIGGSDAATVIGLNPYASQYSLWAEKTGRVPDFEDNEGMRQGRDLEEYVARRFCEATGKRVRRDNHTYYNTKYPWAHANIDRAIIGEGAGLECKTTTTLNLKKFKNGEYPVNYYVQSMHYMAVTGKSKWCIACLVLGKGFYHFEIERDEDEIAALMKAEADFYEYIKTDTEPPVDGTEATTNAISIAYKANEPSVSSIVSLLGYEGTLEALSAVKQEIEALTKRKNELENKIKVYLGSETVGETEKHRVTWREQRKSTFDYKRFAEAHPEIDLSAFFNEISMRVFKLTEKEI